MYRVKALFFFPLVTATLAQDIQGWRLFSREDSNKNNDEISRPHVSNVTAMQQIIPVKKEMVIILYVF